MQAFSFDVIEEKVPGQTPLSKDVDRDPFDEEWYGERLSSGRWCEPLEPWMIESFPKEVFISQRKYRLTSWVMYVSRWGVSEPVMNAINRVCPGVHQFLPITLKYGTKDKFIAHAYFTLQINVMINDINFEESAVFWKTLPDGRRSWRLNDMVRPVLSERLIRGHHIWRSDRLLKYFMSAEMKQVLESEGLADGLRFTPIAVA